MTVVANDATHYHHLCSRKPVFAERSRRRRLDGTELQKPGQPLDGLDGPEPAQVPDERSSTASLSAIEPGPTIDDDNCPTERPAGDRRPGSTAARSVPASRRDP